LAKLESTTRDRDDLAAEVDKLKQILKDVNPLSFRYDYVNTPRVVSDVRDRSTETTAELMIGGQKFYVERIEKLT